MNEYTFKLPPRVVGYWVLPGGNVQNYIKFSCHEKPNVIHRYFMRLLMGWTYEDVKP